MFILTYNPTGNTYTCNSWHHLDLDLDLLLL